MILPRNSEGSKGISFGGYLMTIHLSYVRIL